MKTVEEMRVAVLAECETICPNVGDFSRVRLLWIGKIERTSEVGFDPHYDGKIWAIFAHGGGEILYFIHEDSDEAIIDFAYMLFGFAERDAVEAEKARSFKEIDSCTLSLGKMAIRAKVAEAKNAALVAALGSLKRAVGYKPRRHGEIVLYRNDLGVFIDNAIAANEKGGANG